MIKKITFLFCVLPFFMVAQDDLLKEIDTLTDANESEVAAFKSLKIVIVFTIR